MIGDTATTGRGTCVERFAHSGHGQDRLDADERVGRTDHHGAQAGVAQAPRARPDAGARPARHRNATRSPPARSAAARNSPGSRASLAAVRTRVRTRSSVIGTMRVAMPSRRQKSAVMADRRLAGREPPRALDMRGEVAVAELEPGLAAERRERRHERPGLVAPAPAALAYRRARRARTSACRCRARSTGRDARSRRRCWRPRASSPGGSTRLKPERELGAADAAGERDHARWR